ncbi:MAG: MarR family transcriptional regulator [Sphingomonadaceae bacterium]
MQGAPSSTAAYDGLDQVGYEPGPSILVFSDASERRDGLCDMVRAAGGRVSAALDIAQAVGRIADHAAPDGVIVDLISDGGAAAEQIFDAVEQGAATRRFRSVMLIDPALIDLAAACAGHGDVELLCAPDDEGLSAAIGALMTPRRWELNDVSGDAGPIRLRQLSEEVGRIARALATLSERRRDILDDAAGREPPDAPAIRAMIRARRMRDQFFPAELFADPAWDMLLDLTAAHLERRPVAVSSLCIAAAVPPTTALRWIKTLTGLGMFVRVADPKDRRRIFIELSPEVAATMQECLSAMRPGEGV